MMIRMLCAVLALTFALPTTQANAQNMRMGGFTQLQGNLQHCDLRPGNHSRAYRARARAHGAQLYQARDLQLTLVHMQPMSARNMHATAIFQGRRVPVCVPAPEERVWAVRRGNEYIPIVMDICGNEVVAYATASKKKARKVYDYVDGGEGPADPGGRDEGHGGTPADPGDDNGDRGEDHGGTPADPGAVGDGGRGGEEGHGDADNGGNDAGGRGGEGHGGNPAG